MTFKSVIRHHRQFQSLIMDCLMNGRTDGQIDGQTDELRERWRNRLSDWQTDRQTGGQAHERTDGKRTDRRATWRTHRFLYGAAKTNLKSGYGLWKEFVVWITLWSRTAKNTDWSTEPLARPFTCLLAPLTHFLAPHYLLRSRAPPRSFISSLSKYQDALNHSAEGRGS